jgi:NTP pyrophosphatase (non-canonical NTP hydrolase)
VVSGHELIREIIAKHRADRYPTVELAAMKVAEELGELMAELLRGLYVPMPSDGTRKEYADVGLALYGLGNVLGLDLDEEMRRVAENETRRFD